MHWVVIGAGVIACLTGSFQLGIMYAEWQERRREHSIYLAYAEHQRQAKRREVLPYRIAREVADILDRTDADE